MGINEALRLTVTADTRGAQQGITQLGRTADRELGRSQANLDKWGSRLTSVGAGLISFGGIAAVGLGMAAKSAADLEQAVGGTEAVFGSAQGVIDDYAQHAADSVGLSQTAFRDLSTVAGAQLKNLGFDVDEAAEKSIELTEIGADLAATYGGTTAEAVQALGAAFRGEADPAERFGLSLNVTAANAKAVELGLAASTSEVDANARAQAVLALITEQSADAQGQFAREADTATGQQQRMTAAFEDLKAEIGAGALPAMKSLVGVTGDVVGGLRAVNDATGGAVGEIATIATVASLGVGGLSLLAGQAIKMRGALVSVAGGAQAAATGIRALGLAGAGLAALPLALVAAGGALELWNQKEQRSNVSRLTAEFLAAGESVDGMTAAIQSAVDKGPTEFIGMFGELAATNREAAERFIEVADAAGTSGRVIEEMRAHLETTGAAERQTAEDTGTLTGAMGEQAGATGEANSALQDFQDALAAQFDPVFGMVDALQGQRDATANVAEAQATLNEAIAGGDPTVIAEAQRGYDEALHGASEALVASQSAQLELNDATAANPALVEDARQKIYAWAIQAGLTAEQASGMADQFATATYEAAVLGQQNPNVTMSVTDHATNAIHAVDRELANLDGQSATVTINEILRRNTFGLFNPEGRARGGPVSGGSLYEVTEGGIAELFEAGGRTYLLPGMDGTVVPAGGMAGPTGGGGSTYAPTYNINVAAGLSRPADVGTAVVEAIKGYERANGPGWRGP